MGEGERKGGRERGRKEGEGVEERGRGRACLDVALFVSLRLASNLPCSNLSIETVKPKAWAISIPIEDAGYVGMIEGTTLGAGRQVATP